MLKVFMKSSILLFEYLDFHQGNGKIVIIYQMMPHMSTLPFKIFVLKFCETGMNDGYI